MNYYEWEIDYLQKLINNKRKALKKHTEETSEYTHYRMTRELEALQTIKFIVEMESNHLRAMHKF